MKNINKLFSVLLVFVLGMFLASTINVMAAEPTTVIATYPSGSGTTNMTEGNNAETIGLDPLIFYVESVERESNSLHVGLNNSGQIRLYNSGEGNGNILSIEIAEIYKISKVKFVFGGTVTSALIKSGDNELHNGGLTSNSSLEFADLDTRIVSIKNIGTAQIYILSIEITYQSTQEPLIESDDGASIRTDGVQGLRFYAKVTDNYDNEAKGFYLMFGEATIADLESAISNDMEDSKGKTVVDVPVGGVTVDGEFSVVLTGIPEQGYLDKITVIPYVLVEGTNVFVNPVTRSVGEVAIKMAEDDHALPEGMEDKLNNFTKVLNIENNVLEFSKGLKDSEDNYVNLESYDVYHPETTEEITLPIPEERLGYTFNGWYDNPSFAGDVLTAVSIDFVDTLYAKWEEAEPVGGSFVETFDDSNATTQYADGSFTGLNGVVWTYVHARDEEATPIDGKGIMLRHAGDPSSLSATFTNGIGEFSFEYRKAYTGSRARTYAVDVTHNGTTTTYDLPEFGSGSGEQDDIYEFTQALNLTGTVTIKIYATGSTSNQQAVFDNFAWTELPE